MDYSIRLMKDDEIAFAYTQRQNILQESGCIGHLRVDMDSTGTGFFTSWDNHTAELKTDAFKVEFDEVINELRFGEESGGFLKDRASIKKFVHQFPESSITEDNIAFGLRVDTDDHTEQQNTELDALKSLDTKVKRPANVLGFTYGSLGSIVMGAGMNLIMMRLSQFPGHLCCAPQGIVGRRYYAPQRGQCPDNCAAITIIPTDQATQQGNGLPLQSQTVLDCGYKGI